MSGLWIWPSDDEGDRPVARLALFRRSFTLADAPWEAILSVTADSRYKLFVNGERVGWGPAKGTDREWYVDEIDVGPHLRVGENVIAVEVLRYAPDQRGSVSIWRTALAGLLVTGYLRLEDGTVDVSTGPAWRAVRDSQTTFAQGRMTDLLAAQESWTPQPLLRGWRDAGYDDSGWPSAAVVRAAHQPEPLRPWVLAPRPIPQMTYIPRQFSRARVTREGSGRGPHADLSLRSANAARLTDVEVDALARGTGTVTIPPFSAVTIDLDYGELTVGHVRLAVEGGRGGKLEWLSSEGYEQPLSHVPAPREKGDRTDWVNGDLYGDVDRHDIGGWGTSSEPETHETWWFRTLRYLRLRVTAGMTPVTLRAVDVTTTGYPLEVMATFTTSDKRLQAMWDVSVRTLRLCARETFEDCPYYEGLQYAMDARSQALFMVLVSGDDRLMRRAVRDFALGRTASGLLPSRTPSYSPQQITGFSLFWILMVRDHWMLTGSLDLAREYADDIAGVLRAFARLVTQDGLIGPLPAGHWGFIDWTAEWQHRLGTPTDDGGGIILTAEYIVALDAARTLSEALNQHERARRYLKEANRLRSAVRDLGWCAASGLFADAPGRDPASEHAQIWAVLADVARGDDARRLMQRMLITEGLAKPSYVMSLYRLEALQKVGLAGHADWTDWHAMLDANLTTWMEDPVTQRSDCHAWGSVPIPYIIHQVLGFRDWTPASRDISIAPDYQVASEVDGVVPGVAGPIRISWHTADRGVTVEIVSPPGVRGTIVLPDGRREPLAEGRTTYLDG